MANARQRKVYLSADLKETLIRHWRTNSQARSLSDMVRLVVVSIGEGFSEDQLAEFDSPGKANIRIWVDDDTWEAAFAAVEESGLSMHSVLRRRLMRITGEHTNG